MSMKICWPRSLKPPCRASVAYADNQAEAVDQFLNWYADIVIHINWAWLLSIFYEILFSLHLTGGYCRSLPFMIIMSSLCHFLLFIHNHNFFFACEHPFGRTKSLMKGEDIIQYISCIMFWTITLVPRMWGNL